MLENLEYHLASEQHVIQSECP